MKILWLFTIKYPSAFFNIFDLCNVFCLISCLVIVCALEEMCECCKGASFVQFN